jgi:DNA repair protein RecN (Recombination protein N)
MPGARFVAVVTPLEPVSTSLSESGLDEAEFYFSANRGQEPRPLASTASGGELSRVMLSLRNAASRNSCGRTLVFDEIDTGMGGNAASLVGARLKMLAKASQVICVTHLPQVAAFADRHLHVFKQTSGKTVATKVKSLDKQDRINELARMISGSEVTSLAKGHAKSMIEKAGGK